MKKEQYFRRIISAGSLSLLSVITLHAQQGKLCPPSGLQPDNGTSTSAQYASKSNRITEGYDTDRGFRHPGGLHTYADFDRIRQQLDAGNEKVTAAYNILKNAAYAQADAATYPSEIIIRGGGAGENYINAARGATIAYQNALRWQIDGSEEHAQHAVDVLMQWANTTTGIGGDSNYALAAGLYGYQFAQAAELVRDYEGWSPEDFNKFKRWMLNVWYPSSIGFLRGRNGTWENASKWWQCPGHYWSNWGLCNALAVMSIGVLCDDVFIYNQGLSFYKYDQVGTFEDPRTADPIQNDGLSEFLGNLVVTTQESELETGAYGKLGQMQESGRDIGHATMALGLAVDIAHMAWNQGDDLFSYMDNRLAAGIEYVAAQTQSVEGLPWTDYHYATSGFHWSDSRSQLQTAPAKGEQIRPYWGTVIGHYEGVKGVTMPFSKIAYEKMGIDGGGQGDTSGGYDHLGYSVLTGTRDAIAPEEAPTPLTPRMTYNGITVEHNELGGLTNTYRLESTQPLPAGTIVTLSPQLPDGEADTGQWEWNTGETTKDITIAADRSGVWRATYTNAKGTQSEQVFTIAVEGDCEESEIETQITTGGQTTDATEINVLYGSEVTLSVNARMGWGWYEWENGSTTQTVTLPNVTATQRLSAFFTGQGGRKQEVTFTVNMQIIRPDFTIDNQTYTDSTLIIVSPGSTVTLTPTPAPLMTGGTYLWSDGSQGETLTLSNLQTSGTYTLDYTANGHTATLTYQVYVTQNGYYSIETGDYYIRHTGHDTYLTHTEDRTAPFFDSKNDAHPESQQWHIANTPPLTSYSIMSLLDSQYLSKEGTFGNDAMTVFRFSTAEGTDDIAIMKSVTSGKRYWKVAADGTIDFAASEEPTDYPFKFIPVKNGDGILATENAGGDITDVCYYTPDGIKTAHPNKGLNIRQTTYSNGQVVREKIIIR